MACALLVHEATLHALPVQVHASEVDLDDLSKAEHADCIRCTVCGDPDGEANMAFCSGCNKLHLRCVLPPMATVLSGDWYCLACNLEELRDDKTPLQYKPADMFLNDAIMVCLRQGGGGVLKTLSQALSGAPSGDYSELSDCILQSLNGSSCAGNVETEIGGPHPLWSTVGMLSGCAMTC